MNQAMLLLAFAAGNSGVAMRMMEPMLAQLAADFGVTAAAAAVVFTAFTTAQAGAQFFHGALGDRYGKLKVVTALLVLSGASAFACALAPDLQSLAAGRFALGVFCSGSMTLGMAYIGDVVPADRRQSVLASFLSGTVIGQSLGPFIGGAFTDLLGWRAAFAFLGTGFALNAVVLFVLTRAEWPARSREGGALFSIEPYLGVVRLPKARLVMRAVFTEALFFFGAFTFIGVLMREHFGLPYTVIGLAIAGFGLGGLIYTRVVRLLLVHLGQRGMALGGGLACGLCFIGIAYAPVWPIAFACTACLGFFYYMMHNTLQTRATEMAPHARARALALYSMSWAAGQAVGVALISAGVLAYGLAPMVAVFGAGTAAFGLWFWYRLPAFP